eukprot:CAMPEP_0202503016 /NCGR_PEP_ID=MMETSP1361-20130828/40653_1 /ASSEMBLY_ACC=CAM_ASM_000849 /TAXON_ID=210615 /ORGANISM="Staurosira complex sp., Strain CCMP2646" /LENGTH=425 /DNA_ID=CAMNT_0049136151 /DNA_START=9 /DNA_END=1286 /DNA_ORIENTATION=-
MATRSSPTSVTEDATNNKEDTYRSMAKRLGGGRFSPTRKSSQNVEGIDEVEAPEIFVNEEEEASTDDENIDLSVVRSLIGSNFNLDGGENMKSDTPSEKKSSVTFSGIDSPASSKGDYDKTNGELLAKISRLEMKLKQAELDYSAEKARRKKSSRSTIKLAKEINKRTVEAASQQKAIEKLTTANATLDTKLSATRKELDERIAVSESANRENHLHLSEAQKKYRETCDENDRRVAEMTRLHNQEVENLRRQLSAANRDLDMLRGKLISLEVKEAERIAEHTVYTGIDPTEARKRTLKQQRKTITVGAIALAVAWFYQVTAFSLDAICGPAMPGTTLSKESTYEAPWFAPSPLKSSAFDLCGARERVSMSWTPKGELGRLTIETLDGKKPRILLDRNALSAFVKFDRLDIVERKGKVESIQLPWV